MVISVYGVFALIIYFHVMQILLQVVFIPDIRHI